LNDVKLIPVWCNDLGDVNFSTSEIVNFCLYPVLFIHRNEYFISVCLAIVWSLRYYLALRDQV